MSSPFWQSVMNALLESQRTGGLSRTGTVRASDPSGSTINTRSVNAPISMNEITNSRLQNRRLDAIQEIAYDYNRNFRDYQTRIGEIIQTLGTPSIISPLSEVSSTSPRPRPIDASFQSAAAIQPDIDSISNIFLSYYVYPLATADHPVPQNTQLLTREQIATSTLTYGFTAPATQPLEDPSSNVCPISLEPFQLGDVVCEIRGCGHKFKRPNLMHWFRRNPRCPVCRYDLRDYMGVDASNSVSEPVSNPVADTNAEEGVNEEFGESEEAEGFSYSENPPPLPTTTTSSFPQLLQTMTSNFLQQANFDVSGFRYDNNSIEFEFPIQFDASNIDMFFQQYADNSSFFNNLR